MSGELSRIPKKTANQFEKPWYESKTIWFNLLMTAVEVIAVLQTVVSDIELNSQLFMALATIHGIINVVLRVWFTDQRIK